MAFLTQGELGTDDCCAGAGHSFNFAPFAAVFNTLYLVFCLLISMPGIPEMLKLHFTQTLFKSNTWTESLGQSGAIFSLLMIREL